MTISYVKDGGTLDAGNTGSWAITVPTGGHAIGNLVVVCIGGGTNPTSISLTDSRSNTWTTTEMFDDSGNANYVAIAWSVLTTALLAGDTITITPTAGTEVDAYSVEYNATAGWATSPVDQHTHNSGTFSTDWFPGAVTTTHASELAIAAGVGQAGNTPISPWVERYDHTSTNRPLIVEEQILTSTATIGGAGTVGTLSASQNITSAIITWAEATVTTQKLRPDADNATGGWVTAPLFSKVNEVTADGVTITATAS